MSIAPHIIHGKRNFELDGKDRTSSPRKLDAITLPVLSQSETTYDGCRILPGYPFMEVDEVVTKEICRNEVYQHTLRARGLLRPGHKLESSSLKQPEEGWDEGPQTWLTTDPAAFTIGSVHPTIATLWCVGIDSKDQVTDRVWRVSPTYRGIIPLADGNPKPGKWKGTVNGETRQAGSLALIGDTFVNESGVYNGWPTPRESTLDTSKVAVTHSLLSFTPPPTDKVGRPYTPARVPLLDNIFETTSWYSSAGFTWNWPPGWKLAGVQWDQILDKSIYLYTLTHEYVPKAEPKLT
jgi:hypothetical protein